ncbi:MAG: GGDEF domain-containing protein [Rubrivivax sp.]|nr:GGDEF domain-containing protein [Rubrivivax sp.]
MLDEPPLTPLVQAALQPVLAALLQPVLQRHGEMLAVKDLRSGRYVYASEAMGGFLQRAAAEVLDHTDAELFEPAVATVLRAAEQTAVAHGGPLTSEHRFEQGGSRREFSVLRWATPPDAGGARWLCSVWRDLAPERQREAQLRAALEQIEQQQRANELLQRELADQALRDPASGLHRRAQFEDQLRREVDLSMREHREFAIVFVEIDTLSPKVLALGVAGEQRVLEAVGRLLRGGTRAMDAACRYDEHRFAVLLSGVGLATAHARMEGLRRKCATQIVVHDGQELGFTVAMGVASFPHTAQTHEALVGACDAALAEARRRGGNHVTLAAIRFEAT